MNYTKATQIWKIHYRFNVLLDLTNPRKMHTFSKSPIIPHTHPLPARVSLSTSLPCATFTRPVGTLGYKRTCLDPSPQRVLRLALCVRSGRGVFLDGLCKSIAEDQVTVCKENGWKLSPHPDAPVLCCKPFCPGYLGYVGEWSSHIT